MSDQVCKIKWKSACCFLVFSVSEKYPSPKPRRTEHILLSFKRIVKKSQLKMERKAATYEQKLASTPLRARPTINLQTYVHTWKYIILQYPTTYIESFPVVYAELLHNAIQFWHLMF